MLKLEKIGFYSNLSNFYDLFKPEAVPAKIQEVITFIKNNDTGSSDLEMVNESLRLIKEVFEIVLVEKKSWAICITNKSRGYSIPLKPFIELLTKGEYHEPATSFENFFLLIKTDLRKHCLKSENITDYNSVSDFLEQLEEFMCPENTDFVI